MLAKCVALISLCGVLVAHSARADVFNMAFGLTSVQFVTVGNPSNAPDTRYNGISVGSVDHVYQMGKFEITAGQYTEFLNAVAKSDPHGLYNPEMSDPIGFLSANIQRSGSSPNYSYSVAADWANRPVDYVNFWDAARFVNWLQNRQPVGEQGPSTTEDGAYHDIDNQALFGRNATAKFYIPSEDEWYKAAYHNKTAGLTASYFDYPTGSNTSPINTLPDPGNHANFNFNGYTIGSPYYRTDVGAFVNSPSPYGTFDQGGNVWEWNETQMSTNYRGLRGGSFENVTAVLHASNDNVFDPALEGSLVGFRVAAAVPEPSTGVLALLACGAMWWSRKRFNA